MLRLGSVIWNVTRIDSANLHILTATPNMAHEERNSASFFVYCHAWHGSCFTEWLLYEELMDWQSSSPCLLLSAAEKFASQAKLSATLCGR